MSASQGVKDTLRAAVIAAIAAGSAPASALGLGDIEMQSFLNEPLMAAVELLDTRQLTVDDIRVRLGQSEDFERLGVERSFFLTSINFDIEIDERSGTGRVLLTTEQAVLEPYLDLIIEIRWPSGRLLREYTVLVDPPAFSSSIVSVSARDLVAAQEGSAGADRSAPMENSPETAAGSAQNSRSGGQTRGPQSSVSSDTGSVELQPYSGDSLSLKGSDLAPGEMPQRAFSAETVAQPVPGSRYMIKRDETLWQIAMTGRPAGVSVQQAMLDIRRLNPEAFIDGNINRIKAGYLIYLPEAGDISSDDLATALAEVEAQNERFEAQQSTTPGVTAAASLRVSAEPSQQESGAAAAISRSDARAEGNDAEPAGEAGTQADIQTTAGATSTPGVDASDAPPSQDPGIGSELLAQMQAMSQRLDTLEQIVTLKDEQIATLEQALEEARLAARSRAAADSPGATEAAAAATEMAASGGANSSTGATLPPTSSTSATSSATTPWYLAAAAGLIALLLGGFFVLRRRRASFAGADEERANGFAADDDVFAGVNLSKDDPLLTDDFQAIDDALPGDDDVDKDLDIDRAESDGRADADKDRRGPELRRGGTAPATGAGATAISKLDAARRETAGTQGSAGPRPTESAAKVAASLDLPDEGGSRGYGERKHDDYIDDAGAGDALAEADIYIAYGRYLQAIELLETSIRADPDKAAYRLKLLELYVDMGEESSAREQLDLLKLSEDSVAVARGEELLGEVISPVAAPPSDSDAASAPTADDASEAVSFPARSGDAETNHDLEYEPPASGSIDQSSQPEPAADLEAPIDFSTSGDAAGAPEDAGSGDIEDTFELADVGDEAGLDPSLSGDTDDDEPMLIEFDELEIASLSTRAASDGGEFAIGLGDGDLDPADPDPARPGHAQAESSALDLTPGSVSRGDFGSVESTPEEELGFDLDLSEALLDPASQSSDDAGLEEPLVFAEDADQMATKLDLARAYIDMGDSAGAKTILNEVIAGDQGEHQQEARELLSRLQ